MGYYTHPDFKLFKKKYNYLGNKYGYIYTDDFEFEEYEELIIEEEITEEEIEIKLDNNDSSVDEIVKRINKLFPDD